MAEEAKVRVRLDTKKAKSDLRELGKAAEKTGGRVSGGVKGALGRGAGLMRKGAGAVKSGIKNTIREGAGEVLTGITEGITAPAAEYGTMVKNMAAWELGTWRGPADAKAARFGRDTTIGNNKYNAHLDSAQEPMMRQFNFHKNKEFLAQKGQAKFLANKAVYGTQEVEKKVEEGFNTVKNAVQDLGASMLEGLRRSFGGK